MITKENKDKSKNISIAKIDMNVTRSIIIIIILIEDVSDIIFIHPFVLQYITCLVNIQ